MEPNQPQDPSEELINRAASQIASGEALEFSHLARPSINSEQGNEDPYTLTNDDIYDFIKENRDRTFDHTTREGRELYLRFEEANARRNNVSLNLLKETAVGIAKVPVDIFKGVFTTRPDRTVASLADGILRDARDLAGLLWQSEDPSSPLFRFKDLIKGTGTVEDRIKQFNEARWWNNRSNELEEGRDTILEHWVPDNYKEFAKSLIDPKFANALSYIGLDAPEFIASAFRKQGLKASVKAFKGGPALVDALEDSKLLHKTAAENAAATEDWFSNSARKFRELSLKITGETMVGTAAVASAPYEFIKERILRGSAEIESRVGHIPNEISNGASTFLTDVSGSVGGKELSPVRGVLFSLGVKPIAEYVSVLGNELIDAAQGVVKVPSAYAGQDLMGRLALNGGRIPLSKEGQAVAKFANVVVGWPASMAFPALKRAVGDAAYMGVLGSLNARGEGFSQGTGMGFAWGGFSGAIRHIHNVYSQEIAQTNIIKNFDNGVILEIGKSSPVHADNVRSFLKFVDSKGDARVSAAVRAQFMMGWHTDPDTQVRHADVNALVKEFGLVEVIRELGTDLTAANNAKGGELNFGGKRYVWLNPNAATPETGLHEYGHRFLDILFSRNDGSAKEAIRSFIGGEENSGVVPDEVLAAFIAHYSMGRYIHLFGGDKNAAKAWLESPDESPVAYFVDKDGNPVVVGGSQISTKGLGTIVMRDFGNIAYARAQIRRLRDRLKQDPVKMFDLDYQGGADYLVFKEFPLLKRLMHETFAYNQSNSLLLKSPDVFLRNPQFKSIRATMENWFTLMNQRKVNDLETAGVLIRNKEGEYDTLLEAIFWDDGKYQAFPMLEKWSTQVMRDVMRYGDVHVSTLSPERQEAYLKQAHKTRFLSGGRMKNKKEVEEQITQDADAIAAAIESLPESVRPKFQTSAGGNKRIKLTELNQEAWQAIYDTGVYSREEFNNLKGMVDVMKQVEAGKPVFNTFTAQYLGWSQQVVEAALGERLKGRQVPITFRHFAPFDIELIVSKFDELGNPLRTPRSHITVHAMDINVLNRRKMNMWQRTDVKSLFKDFGHYTETFLEWFEQFSLDPSQRKPSAEFLRPEFGKNAERVRDVMYETWGGRKRNDESYINVPEGYAGGRDGPLYPIHSLRFDLMANLQRQSQIFPEAFRGQVMGLRFREGVAYEPMRRNAMVGGFVQRELNNGRRFYTDANGYEIRGEEPSLKLFNPFGNLVGVFKTFAKAQSAVEKNLKTVNPAELAPTLNDFGDVAIREDIVMEPMDSSAVYSGSANLMVSLDSRGRPRFLPLAIDHGDLEVKKFNGQILQHVHDVRINGKTQGPADVPSIKISKLVSNAGEWRKALGPVFDFLEVVYDPRSDFSGGLTAGLMGGPQGARQFAVSEHAFATAGDLKSTVTLMGIHLQGLLDFKNKRAGAIRTAFADMDGDFMSVYRSGVTLGHFYTEFNADTTYPIKDSSNFDAWLQGRQDEMYDQMAVGILADFGPNGQPIVAGKIPKWVSGGVINTRFGQLPRYAQALFNRFSTSRSLDATGNRIDLLALMPDPIKVSLNDWAVGLAESFLNGQARVFSAGPQFVAQVRADKWELPADVQSFLSQHDQKNLPTFESFGVQERVGAYSAIIEAYKENLWAAHAFSKMGDRQTIKSLGKHRTELFIAENVAASKDTIGSFPTAFDPAGNPIEFKAERSDTPKQVARFLHGMDGKTLVFTGISDLAGSKTYVVTEKLTLMGSVTAKGVVLPFTTDPASGLENPMHTLLGQDGQIEMPTDLEATILGIVPFSGISGRGTMYKNFDTGWHVSHVEDIAKSIKIPFDQAKDGTAQGLQAFTRMLYSKGLDSADLVYLHGVATGAMMAEIAKSIIAGDPNNYFSKMMGTFATAKGSMPVNWRNVAPNDFAKAIANRGYAKIIHTGVNASMDSLATKPTKKGINPKAKLALASTSSIVSASLNVKGDVFGHHKNTPKVASAITAMVNQYKALGYNLSKSVPRNYETKGQLMLGGFTNSTAKERDMLETGAMRLVKTDSGRTYKAFEFSDKDATLLLEKVGGKMHLVPFMEDGEKGFETFVRNTEMGLNAVFMDTNSVKLGDILDHRLLYLHYPSLKNVVVQWKEGYGADYNPDSDVIRLGIDTFIGDEMSSRRSPDYRTHASFGHEGQRYATETLLHEIQHAIQMREMWTDSYALTAGPQSVGGPIMAANISGVAGRTIAESGRGKVVNEAGTLIYSDDPTRAPTNFSDAETLRSIYRLGNTPMHKHLRQIAYPAFMRVSNEAINALTDAHLHHPPAHPARRNAESAVKSIVAMRNEAKELADRFSRGEISEDAFKSMMCDLDSGLASRFIKRITQVRNSMFLDKSVLGYKLYDHLDNVEKYLHRSIEALDGFEFIAKMAERDGLNGDVILASTKLRQVFNNLAGMHYLSQRHEIEANLTEKRSRMTQAELNSTGLNPDGSRKTLLDTISGAMDIGYKGNTLRNIGIALRNKQRVRVADLMIGGVGSKDPSHSVRNKDVISLLARTSLISWTIRQLKNELDSLDRVAIIGRGWEVAEDGSVKLVAKTATIQLDMKKPRKEFRKMGEDIVSGIPDDPQSGRGPVYYLDDEDKVHVTNAIWGSGERTVTMEDIARIIDGIVTNEWEIRTPTEAMDAILRDDFPSVVRVSELEKVLRDRGVSEDGITMANIGAFFVEENGRSRKYGSLELTKYELANLLAVFHKQYVNERIVSTTEGVQKFRGVNIDTSQVTPERLITAIEQQGSHESDPLRSFIYERTGSMFDLAESEQTTLRSEGGPRIGIANFVENQNLRSDTVQFSPFSKPTWMSNEDFDAIVQRLEKKGYFNQGSFFYRVSMKGSNLGDAEVSAAQALAIEMNKRIRRKLFLIKPFYERVMGVIDSANDQNARHIKVRLLDEMTKAMIEPELEAMREYTSASSLSNTQGVILGGSAGDFAADFSKGPSARFGMTLALVGSGNDLSGGSGFIELQTIQTAVGPTMPDYRQNRTFVRGGSEESRNYDASTWDEGTMRYLFRENAHDQERMSNRTFEHLHQIISVTKDLAGVAREILDMAESAWDGEATIDKLNKVRLINDISGRLSQVEERTTSLIGDNKESHSDAPSRNVITGQSYIDGVAQRIAQESFLLKGYVGKDGSIVVGETKTANTVSSVQLKGLVSMPYFDGSGVPSVAANPAFVTSAVSSLIARDIAVRTVLFGEIREGDSTQSPLEYIAPISDFVEQFRVSTTPAISFDNVAAYESVSVKNTVNGLHALHSAVYVGTARLGKHTEINGALGASKDFYETWGMNWPNLRAGVNGASDVSAASYVPAMAPLIAAAFSPKQVGVRSGKLTIVDHLLPEQRQLLKNARDAYRDFSMDTGSTPTPEQKAASDAFFQSISEKQHGLMFGHLDTANSEITFSALCGAYEAMSMIRRLPEAPAMDAMFGRGTKELLVEEIGKYLSEGRYLFEKGNSEGPMGRTRLVQGNSGRLWMQAMYSSIMGNELNRHLLLGVWSLMDQHASGYRTVIKSGDPSKHDYPHYYRNGYKQNLLQDFPDKPYADIHTVYPRRVFAVIGTEKVLTDSHNITTAIGDPVHSLASTPSEFRGGDRVYDHHLLEPTETGLAESLFEPIDPLKTSTNYVADVNAVPQNTSSPVIGASRIDVGMRGSPVSAKLTRKQMVDSIIRQARKSKTDVVSIEPARMRLSGRLISSSIQRNFESSTAGSREGVAFRAHAYGVSNNLFGPYTLITKNESGTQTSQNIVPPRVALTEPMRGFAWKRLEDGSLVLNISGDITGYKAGYLGNQTRIDPSRVQKLPTGFSIRESLGYDPRSGEISNANPYITLFGMQTASLGGMGAAGLQRYFRIGGEDWRKQIVAAARNRLKYGDAVRPSYEGTSSNREGIRNSSNYINFNVYEALVNSENAHNDKDVVALALAINGHKTGAQHITLTFSPEEANPDMIKAVLMAVMVQGQGAELMQSIWNRVYERQGSDMNPYLGDGEKIMELLKLSGSNAYYLSGPQSRLEQIMGQRVPDIGRTVNATEIPEILALGGSDSIKEGGRTPDEARAGFEKRADQIISRSQDIIPDIERIASAAVGADHGYILPDAERHLAKNGDLAVSIQHMFPNRPELQQFAWDGKETNGVSIVHRGPKAKPTGYFVTYDIQTGVTDSGEPMYSRKVVPVKTLVEAEALRNKYGTSASKAILAQALVSAGSGQAVVKDGVMSENDNVDVSVRANKHLGYSERQAGNLAMVNDGTFTVGDLDLNLSKAEATALSAALGSRSVLQTKIPPVEVGRANLMIGNADARELEGMLRRKLNFGFGQGPIEFVSKMMRVVAYGKRKTGRDKYPDSMTGLEWFKFLKENSVSKDEIRMSGIAYLLHDNAETHLTRRDLAEFIYTVYPRTSRQARTTQRDIGPEVSRVKTGSLSGVYDMPYLEDLQTKEDFVIKTHLNNLESVAGLIEESLQDDTKRADAEALKNAIMKSIEYTVAEMGAPNSLTGLTDLTTAINHLRNLYQEGRDVTAYTIGGYRGESRKVRPAILEYVMADSIFGRTGDQYRTIETAIGDLGLINPYSIQYADTSSNVNPFSVLMTNGDRGQYATSLNQGVGPMSSSYDSSTPLFPLYQAQNFYYHGGNYHSSWASFTGYYQSNPIFTEYSNRRIKAERDAAVKILRQRIEGASDNATKAKYESIISNINRVFEVREMIKAGHTLGDFGHYSDNDHGTFQIGHVRTTQTILSGEYGFGDPKTPNYHAEDSVYGYTYDPEVVLAIEEIQSDSFQYHSFGVPSTPEKALPDSLEQVEGFKRSGDMAKLIESRDKLRSVLHNVGGMIGTNIHRLSQYGYGDVELNANYAVRLLGSLSPIERFLLRTDLGLIDSGRTVEVPENMRKYTNNLSRIPVFEFPDISEYKEGGFMSKEGYSHEIAQKVSNELMYVAGQSVLAGLLPEKVGMHSLEDSFNSIQMGNYSSSSRAITPSLIFALSALADEEVISKSIEIEKANKDILPYKGIDWDSVARRTLDRLKARREEIINRETGDTYTKYAKIKFFDALMDSYEEWISSPQNRSSAIIVDHEKFLEWQYTGMDEYNDLQKHVFSNKESFRVITPPHAYKSGVGGRLFPSQRGVNNDLETFVGKTPSGIAGTRTFEIGTKEFEEMNMNHFLQYRVGATALGNMVANSVQPLIALMSSAADAPERLKQIEKDITELAKVLPVMPSGRDPAILNSLPFGVEDVYKPISLNGTVMRAANAGLSAITYADARHQVNRGHSMDTAAAMLVGRQSHIMYMGQDNPKAFLLSYLNMLPDWLTYQLHGGFMARMANFGPDEFRGYFRNRQAFEHNGVNAPYNVHLLLTLKDAMPHLFTEGISIDDVPADNGLREVWKALSDGNIESIKDEVTFSDSSFKGDSFLVDPDGKPLKPRDLSTLFMQQYYGKQIVGEKKNGSQRAIDNGLANIGRYHFWFERGDAMGYVSQYGAPSWFMESIMWGQSKKNLQKFATDAFIRPNAVLRDDGTYAIINSKTGQTIMEGIRDIQMLKEAMLQNSEYVGSLPYIGQFVKQWGPVGGYVTLGHSNGSVTGSDNVEWSRHFGFDEGSLDPTGIQKRRSSYRNQAPNLLGNTATGTGGGTFANAPTKPMSPTGYLSTQLGYKIWFKHVMKVDVTDSDAVSNALTTIATSGGPVLRFKPKFPSEAHKAAFRKKIVEGIALLMPADGGLGKPKADTATLETLSRIYKWFSKTTQGRKIPTQGEALQDEDESSR